MTKYTDKHVRSYSGAQAEKLIAEKNDMGFLSEDGIVKVDHQRWEEAQQYEQRTWMTLNRKASNDRNDVIRKEFEHYSFLKGETFHNVCEIGCGPFTNLRLILPLIQANKVTLVDPLIKEYLKHPKCSYPNKFLHGYPVDCVASMAEDFRPTIQYDLVVMINVLPHCMDANGVFERLWAILKTGGTLVFHEVAFNMDVIKNNQLYDAGHPILVSSNLINTFLSRFEKIFERRVDFDANYCDHYIFYAGRKV
jgi:2-polyprenyl-3-methyl-5-hydroxy-6-metoxy-1,4-benzoquinol methylase